MDEDYSVPYSRTSASSGSNNKLKAMRFFKEAERNRRLIEKLERESSLSVLSKKSSWSDVASELQDHEKQLTEEREIYKMNLQKQLINIHQGVRKFQTQLVDVKPTPALLEKLNQIMSEVEMSINNFKKKQSSCFEEFLKDERMCKQEISACEKKIDNWSLAVKTDANPQSAPTTKAKSLKLSKDLPAEVRALETFLQKTGGTCGGWDQYDHQAFLKMWTKHSGRPAFRPEAKVYLPGKTMEDIEEHERWYREVIFLQDKKREAIQRWKRGKQQQRQNRIQEEAKEAEKREMESNSQEQQQKVDEKRREAARQLEEWKEERRRREEHEEELRLAEEMQRRRRAKEERRRQLELKLTLEEHLRMKKEEEEELERRKRDEEQRELDERRREATKGIKLLLERDLHRVEEKIQQKQLKERQEEERQIRIASKLKEKVDSHISRDPSRLTRPTKGWEERMKNVGPSGEGPLLHMWHRAVPAWRQGL